jgi:hypothetical protein
MSTGKLTTKPNPAQPDATSSANKNHAAARFGRSHFLTETIF